MIVPVNKPHRAPAMATRMGRMRNNEVSEFAILVESPSMMRHWPTLPSYFHTQVHYGSIVRIPITHHTLRVTW